MSLAFPLCLEPHSHPLPELCCRNLLADLSIAVDDEPAINCWKDIEPSRVAIVAFEANSDGILGSTHFLHFASCKSVRDEYLWRVQKAGRHIINCSADYQLARCLRAASMASTNRSRISGSDFLSEYIASL
jgi:hypothetical protein